LDIKNVKVLKTELADVYIERNFGNVKRILLALISYKAS